MPSSSFSFLKQRTFKEAWKSSFKNWGSSIINKNNKYCSVEGGSSSSGFGQSQSGCGRSSFDKMEGLNCNENENNGGMVMRKRVMVLIDQTSHSKHAMMFALTHVCNRGDLLTLLHIVPPGDSSSGSDSYLANSLGSLCKACKPEVEVEALLIQGPKLSTLMSQVKKLDVSVLVLGLKKASPFLSCLCKTSSSEEFVEECINNVECMTIGVRKQSKGVSGYLISTKWQKNFWLLA